MMDSCFPMKRQIVCDIWLEKKCKKQSSYRCAVVDCEKIMCTLHQFRLCHDCKTRSFSNKIEKFLLGNIRIILNEPGGDRHKLVIRTQHFVNFTSINTENPIF
jgi:hypothetical protein